MHARWFTVVNNYFIVVLSHRIACTIIRPASGSHGVMDSMLVNVTLATEQRFRRYVFFRQYLRSPNCQVVAKLASSSPHRRRLTHLFVTSLGEHYVVRHQADVMESRVTSSVNKPQPTIIRQLSRQRCTLIAIAATLALESVTDVCPFILTRGNCTPPPEQKKSNVLII